MNRRDLLTLLAGLGLVRQPPANAQKAMPVIGAFNSTSPGPNAPLVAAFRQGVSEIGYVEGQNVTIEYSWAEGHYDASALAAKSATSTIPIVFVVGADPVAAGLVASLARPGGNLTGVGLFTVELVAKRLELISELVPQASVIALLVNPNYSTTESIIRDAQEAARTKGVQLEIIRASTEAAIDAAFATLGQLRAGALIVGADPFFASRRQQLVALAARHAVPVIYFWREFAAVGGLISYAPSIADGYRQAGIYAGRILKGAKPADLPVQQPATFELVVNLTTAKTLGLTVPPSILARAEEVVE